MATEFKSQICTTVEQSKRLLGLGLKKETADMSIISKYLGCDDDGVLIYEENIYTYPPSNEKICPAWSLHRLIGMMPKQIEKDMSRKIIDFWVLYEGKVFYEDFDFFDNLYDNIIDCIEWLIKEGYFNKEYLV